jgi:hypothetical protein
MTVTFENDNDVIVYALEKVISFAKRTQHIFVAQCVWWLSSIIGLEQELINHIDNLQPRRDSVPASEEELSRLRNPRDDKRTPQPIPLQDSSAGIHPDRIPQIEVPRGVSTVPRDLTEDQRLDRILQSAERVIQDSFRTRTIAQQGRVNPLPTTRTQLKKARKVKRLQEANRKQEAERSQRLREIRATVIQNLSKD